MVALAEVGDKTQLIALTLASRYRRAWTAMLGILLATILNHALAATVGVWVASRLPPSVLAWIVGLGFVAFGIWTLFPDRAPEPGRGRRWGPLLTTTIVFFLAEMGDKTQLATVALGARFLSPVAVTAGTTLVSSRAIITPPSLAALDAPAADEGCNRGRRLASANPVPAKGPELLDQTVVQLPSFLFKGRAGRPDGFRRHIP